MSFNLFGGFIVVYLVITTLALY